MQCLLNLVFVYIQFVTCVAVLPDGRVVSGSGDYTLRVWNTTSGECDITLEGHTEVSMYMIVDMIYNNCYTASYQTKITLHDAVVDNINMN